MGLNETVELRPRSCDFNVGAGDSVTLRWTFPDPVDVTEWVQATVYAETTVHWELQDDDADDSVIVAILDRTAAAPIASGRWYLRHVVGDEQRTYKGRWTVT